MNRRDEVPGAPPPLGTPARSLYDLVYHHKPPVSHGLGPAGLHEAMDISNMELYKDIILGKVPIEEGQSLATRQSRSSIRSNSSVTKPPSSLTESPSKSPITLTKSSSKSPSSITKSLSRSFSFKTLRDRIRRRRSSQVVVSGDDYSPKKHDDSNGANITGGALASYLRFSQKSSTWNSGHVWIIRLFLLCSDMFLKHISCTFYFFNLSTKYISRVISDVNIIFKYKFIYIKSICISLEWNTRMILASVDQVWKIWDDHSFFIGITKTSQCYPSTSNQVILIF